MPTVAPPDLREAQLTHIVAGIERFYAEEQITYTQLEEAMKKMSDEDLQSALVYTTNGDIKQIANQVLGERDVKTSPRLTTSIHPNLPQEVLF